MAITWVKALLKGNVHKCIISNSSRNGQIYDFYLFTCNKFIVPWFNMGFWMWFGQKAHAVTMFQKKQKRKTKTKKNRNTYISTNTLNAKQSDCVADSRFFMNRENYNYLDSPPTKHRDFHTKLCLDSSFSNFFFFQLLVATGFPTEHMTYERDIEHGVAFTTWAHMISDKRWIKL